MYKVFDYILFGIFCIISGCAVLVDVVMIHDAIFNPHLRGVNIGCALFETGLVAFCFLSMPLAYRDLILH